MALAFILTEGALAGNGGIAPPEPASPSAERIRDAYWMVLVFTTAIFVLVEGALLLFIVGAAADLARPKGRRSSGITGSRSSGR